MKKILVLAAVVLVANIFIAKQFNPTDDKYYQFNDTLKVFKPSDNHENEEKIISAILSRYHYKRTSFNDSLSSVVLDKYIKTLDYNKNYFLSSDIEDFEKFRNTFDEGIQEGNLDAAFYIFNVFYRRFNERINYGLGVLQKEPDFNSSEKYVIDREFEPWPKSTSEANEIWRKRIKNDALNLKLADKEWSSIKETLTKRYYNLKKTLLQYDNEDVFQFIMNAYTEVVDPHTNYLSPITSEDFKINMSLSLDGIGAQLQSEDEYVKIAEIVPGGPAAKSGLLHKGDRIVGVKQENETEFVDVIGWRLTDVVQLIRGPKGTVVRLQVLYASEGAEAVPKEIKITRDKIKLEEQAAKQKIIDVKENGKNYKIGVITIPTFYSDFEAQQRGDKDFKSTTKDVRKLLAELKEKNVDGVVIDLRSNGGGSLTEAINLTGLFIEEGPVVQVKKVGGNVDVNEDEDPDILYSGPMAVMVNKFSASASEIFAAAIQDYGRGIVLGDQTYGKGTVQSLIDLNDLMHTEKESGQVKVTIAKFYRVNGESTQLKGVVPDIKFPSFYDDPKEFGESSEPSAMKWDKIKTSNFKPFSSIDPYVEELKTKHMNRVKDNFEYKVLLEDINTFKEQRNKKEISLKESDRKKEKEEAEKKKLNRENERRKNKGLNLITKDELKSHADAEEKFEDFMLRESGNILADFIQLQTSNQTAKVQKEK